MHNDQECWLGDNGYLNREVWPEAQSTTLETKVRRDEMSGG